MTAILFDYFKIKSWQQGNKVLVLLMPITVAGLEFWLQKFNQEMLIIVAVPFNGKTIILL